MDKEAQVVIIGLWILIILTILAVSIGHRVSLGLRLSKYQRDSLKAVYLAKAGVNRAIAELEKDKSSNDYDSLNETWSTGVDSDNNHLFENIEIEENSGETFTVGYRYNDDKYICMEDEERKINVDRTDNFGKQQLIELFKLKDISEEEATDLANNIIDWIDDNDIDSIGNKENQIFKNKPLKVTEELVAILEYSYQQKEPDKFQEKAQEVFSAIKDLITVYGQGSVNINTVSEDVLTILANTIAENNPDQKNCVSRLVDDLIRVREEKGKSNMDKIPFHNSDEITSTLTDPNCVGLLGNLKTQGNLTFKSNYFRIESTGNIGPTARQINKKIMAIYHREPPNSKIISWHEN